MAIKNLKKSLTSSVQDAQVVRTSEDATSNASSDTSAVARAGLWVLISNLQQVGRRLCQTFWQPFKLSKHWQFWWYQTNQS
jgi:hypothetical protein